MLVCTSLRDAGSEGLEEPPKLVNATMQAPPALGIDVQTLFAVSALVDQLHEKPGRSNQHLESHGRKQAVIGLFFLVESLQLVSCRNCNRRPAQQKQEAVNFNLNPKP